MSTTDLNILADAITFAMFVTIGGASSTPSHAPVATPCLAADHEGRFVRRRLVAVALAGVAVWPAAREGVNAAAGVDLDEQGDVIVPADELEMKARSRRRSRCGLAGRPARVPRSRRSGTDGDDRSGPDGGAPAAGDPAAVARRGGGDTATAAVVAATAVVTAPHAWRSPSPTVYPTPPSPDPTVYPTRRSTRARRWTRARRPTRHRRSIRTRASIRHPIRARSASRELARYRSSRDLDRQSPYTRDVSEQQTTRLRPVGGMAFFESLVHRFYEGVADDPVLLPLYPEPDDLAPARRRLTLFLAQYWGGP